MNNYIPSTVYHYCSVETFCKIITNKELWLTDVTKSNDSKELQIALDEITNKLNEKVNIDIIGKESAIPLMMIRKIFRNFRIIDLLFHICCFSTDFDSLSQWSMYANNATGLAIGFDCTKFNKLTNQCDKFDFKEINYSVEPLHEIINNKVTQTVNAYLNRKSDNDIYWYLEFLNYCFDDMMKMSYLFKHESFRQEHEYRISFNSKPYYKVNNGNNIAYTQNFIKSGIKISDDFEIGDIGYYTSRGKLISYRPLHIRDIGSCINEIIIGPKSLISENDIKMFLLSNNINLPHYKIKLSKSTYQ